jgi:hypothetical protein
MALNPFFLQGSPGEQNLVQDLINEHLRMFGIEVYYIPRKYIDVDNIIREVNTSKFDDNFLIEAYLNNYEGYGQSYDIMTKFGLKLTNEITLTISRERFEEFISPFLQTILEAENSDPNVDEGANLLLASRPREGDLIYFPLGERLFEIKRVEFENPFYQLGKNYVYELKCELFEYEDEKIDTGIEDIQDAIKETGYITTLTLVGFGTTAIASAGVGTGVVGQIYITNDGYNYSSPPIITFDPPPLGGVRATAVAITTSVNGSQSIKEILLTNAGFGYTAAPGIAITSGGGSGAAATCSIVTGGVYTINLDNNGGANYYKAPIVTIAGPVGSGVTATAIATISNGKVNGFRITNAGSGYTTIPVITIAPPPVVGVGTYIDDEEVVGSLSGTRAFIKSSIIKKTGERVLKISINTGRFIPGEIVIGAASSATYHVKSFEDYDLYDQYAENDEIEAAADLLLDFSESNPFGDY